MERKSCNSEARIPWRAVVPQLRMCFDPQWRTGNFGVGRKRGVEPITAAFQFQAGIRDRCDEPPVAQAFTEVGSYRFFTG